MTEKSNAAQRVLIAAPVHPLLSEGLQRLGFEPVLREKITRAEALELLPDCAGLITSTRLQVDKALIDTAPHLQFIGRMGSGMEVIDVPYARGKGIACFGSADGNCRAVGEHALGMLLSLSKRISWSAAEVRQGKWLRDENRGFELEGRTIGIIGYGHTGRAFCKLLRGFDMRILVFDKYHTPAPEDDIEVCTDLQAIYENAEIVSLHVPFAEDTHNMIDGNFVASMRKNFILLNTSRGSVIDHSILEAELETGKLTGFAADVWEQEPLEKADSDSQALLARLVERPEVLITPHIAGYSREAVRKMSLSLLKQIER